MIEVGDLLKPRQDLVLGSANGTIPKDELFLVIPTPQGRNCHADCVWVEPLVNEGIPHQLYLDYVEKVQ